MFRHLGPLLLISIAVKCLCTFLTLVTKHMRPFIVTVSRHVGFLIVARHIGCFYLSLKGSFVTVHLGLSIGHSGPLWFHSV